MGSPAVAEACAVQGGRMKIEFVVPGLIPPTGNMYVRHAVINGQLRSYQTKEAKAFKAIVAAYAQRRTISPIAKKDQAKVKYRVIITVVLGKKQRQDADNGLKVGIDSLKECGVIHSDARVAEAIGRVIWNDRERPRTIFFAEVIKPTQELFSQD
jgi:Holliday junction resolvase RusA-like endonuclease